MIRGTFISSIICLLAGFALQWHALTLPVYTDPGLREQLTKELADKPDEDRTREWFVRLGAVETPHKKLWGLGAGLCGLGCGLMIACAVWRRYRRALPGRRAGLFGGVWLGVLALKIPLSLCQYVYLQVRGDYPWWADIIMIPIVFEVMGLIFAGGLSSMLIRLTMKGREWPDDLHLRWPTSILGWLRFGLLTAWPLFLTCCAYDGVKYGNPGDVIACVSVMPLFLAVLCARPEKCVDSEGVSVQASAHNNDGQSGGLETGQV